MNLAERAAELLGARIERSMAVAGGDLSEVLAIELDDGRNVIVKRGPAPALEAEMLLAIGARGVAAPAVLAFDDRILVLERLPHDGHIGDAWASLGAVLGQLHAAGLDAKPPSLRGPYGWHADYAFAGVGIENAWIDDWARFWAERRLLSQLSCLPRSVAVRVEALARRVSERLPADPGPRLLHGDLWTGNVLVAAGRVTGLIDPACYYGDPEVDLAMLQLFGHPPPAFFAAYGALPPDTVARRPVYQLWPALVHFRLFGSSYRGLLERLLAEAGV